ncbi:Crp/Fnr family transcriptional regulator [Mucilaginibacter sp. SP1R1]|uniref:Crp/Fnr family transcriptional regulator n=1 Tax=Mucilaginibacter sp. SP1R1 TaxID=2723091 RepID=UPI00161808A2|nr:Crp/Fnr family transcriptional regulator [Mucilaginibacter sp. SP1R1]MBB6151684.1 CRP-like cAMP-binding protein [Mucilaginibacter sp. SP1R1]
MQDFSAVLNHIAPHITLNEEEKKLFLSVLKLKKVKRKQFVEQPGFVSKHRTYVVEGALRAYFIGEDGQEHTISLAVDDWWIGDPGSFLFQEPATLFIEAIEDSTLVQWSYESEQLLLEKIPQFPMVMMQRWQRMAVMIQKRVISNLSLSAEERYEEFAQRYPAFVQRIPLYIIASYLGMSREFLSKIRNQRISAKN